MRKPVPGKDFDNLPQHLASGLRREFPRRSVPEQARSLSVSETVALDELVQPIGVTRLERPARPDLLINQGQRSEYPPVDSDPRQIDIGEKRHLKHLRRFPDL